VPVFFFVSGFLIYLSFSKNNNLANYTRNRLLRIYPGLWACLVVGIISVIIFSNSPINFISLSSFKWLVAQVSIGQFYNPDFLREYACGTLNGSLWTIPVELQFYIFVPILFIFKNKIKTSFIALCTILSYISQETMIYMVANNEGLSNSTIVKLFEVSIIPYLWMFLIGCLAQKYSKLIVPWVQNKLGWALLLYAIGHLFLGSHLRFTTNNPDLPSYLITAFLVLSFAYTKPNFGWAWLKKVDLSYGIYIYHMIVINVLIEINFNFPYPIIVVFIATAGLASASWFLIEKPSLRRKKTA